MTTDPFVRFGDDLVAAARRRFRRRRRIRRVGVLAAGGLLLAAAPVLLVATDRAQASSIVVEARGDGRVVIHLARSAAPADDVADDLRDAGFDVELTTLATGPSRVGAVISLVSLTPGTGAPDGGVVVEPAGTVVVRAGRAAAAGERYEAVTDAFAPEEPLACLGRPGMTVGVLVEVLAERGHQVTFRELSGVDVAQPRADDGRYVQGAFATSADDVTVMIGATPPADVYRSPCAPS